MKKCGNEAQTSSIFTAVLVFASAVLTTPPTNFNHKSFIQALVLVLRHGLLRPPSRPLQSLTLRKRRPASRSSSLVFWERTVISRWVQRRHHNMENNAAQRGRGERSTIDTTLGPESTFFFMLSKARAWPYPPCCHLVLCEQRMERAKVRVNSCLRLVQLVGAHR